MPNNKRKLIKNIILFGVLSSSIYFIPKINKNVRVYKQKTDLYRKYKFSIQYVAGTNQDKISMIRDDYINDRTVLIQDLLYSLTEVNLICELNDLANNLKLNFEPHDK